jgi:dTDP-4-dehydrorhamnose 3,5-epimerase
MLITETEFPGLFLVKPHVFEDARGYFFESYSQKEFSHANLQYDWVQDNQSRSGYGVIRGLHYQLNPFSQAKLIRVLDGTILDIAVDLRKGSPTFGKTFAIELSSANRYQLLIPKGFAHGFSVLSPAAEVFYKCDNYYHRDSEAGIRYNDPALAIDWKIPEEEAVVSAKDRQHPEFGACRNNFEFRP